MKTDVELQKVVMPLKNMAIEKRVNKLELTEIIRSLQLIKKQLENENLNTYVAAVDNLIQDLGKILNQPNSNAINMLGVNAESAAITARCLKISNMAKQ